MKTILLSLMAAVTLTAGAEELKQTLYFDFGSITPAQGSVTDGADSNGNYWNNITNNTSGNKYAAAGTVYDGLINSANMSTGYSLTLNSRFSTNGKSNGGGLMTPDAALLNDLAIASATEDYFFIESSENNSNFTISGLDPAAGYRFTVFASRKASDTRTGIYTMQGINVFSGDLTLAGTNIGGDGINQNIADVLVSDLVYPDDDGNIIFTVSRRSGNYIALNALKIEEYTGGKRPAPVPTVTNATLCGSATETDAPVNMHEVSVDGNHSNVFEAYMMLRPGTFTIDVTTEKGDFTYGTNKDGRLSANAGPVTVAAEQLSFIRADFTTGELSIVPITSWGLTGSIVPGGWTLTDNANLDYQGNGVWSATVDLSRESTVTDPERFVFVMNKSWTYQMKRIAGTEASVGLSSDGYKTEDIRLRHGTYTITLDLREFVYRIESPNGIDPYRISVMGSSVANGEGADSNRGYAYMYGQLLGERHESSVSESPFYTSGISVNGNNTVNLLDRYSELTHEFGRYVIFGVSLGNEGIHGAADQEKVFNQFRDNMQLLISKARADGKVPVVMNNYTRGDFDSSDYEWVRRMNLLIHQWDVPSVNLLGAIDNGSGKWADGYQHGDDIYHPSTDGHREFLYAMPPSLFDALHAGKSLPERHIGNDYAIAGDGSVEFTPENITHSFALCINITELPQGHFATVVTTDGNICLSCTDGILSCTLPGGEKISGQLTAPDIITLTHYYAQGRILLYAGDNLLGETAGHLIPEKVTLTPSTGTLCLSEVLFYRSALNDDEVAAIHAGRMLRSSLEIYLPFDKEDPAANLAQSMNVAAVIPGTPSSVQGVAADSSLPETVSVYNTMGVLIRDSLDLESVNSLPSGFYILVSPVIPFPIKRHIP